MVKLTKEDENKLGQILKELNEMKDVLKGGEGSGVRGHKTEENESFRAKIKRGRDLGIQQFGEHRPESKEEYLRRHQKRKLAK